MSSGNISQESGAKGIKVWVIKGNMRKITEVCYLQTLIKFDNSFDEAKLNREKEQRE